MPLEQGENQFFLVSAGFELLLHSTSHNNYTSGKRVLITACIIWEALARMRNILNYLVFYNYGIRKDPNKLVGIVNSIDPVNAGHIRTDAVNLKPNQQTSSNISYEEQPHSVAASCDSGDRGPVLKPVCRDRVSAGGIDSAERSDDRAGRSLGCGLEKETTICPSQGTVS